MDFNWVILFVFCYVLMSNVVCGEDDYGIDYGSPAAAPAPVIVPLPVPTPGGGDAQPLLSNVFTVTDYGAIGDGVADNTQAFANTWKTACSTGDSTIVVPAGGTFFVNSIDFVGPCNGPIEFQISGTIAASGDASLGQDHWIMFTRINGLTISGTGALDGKGAVAWGSRRSSLYLDMDVDANASTSDEKYPPVSLKLYNVTNAAITGITSANSKLFHINLHKCQGINIQNVIIIAPADSPNTDGIHIAKSSNINIADVQIGTGDDCISIGDGATNVEVNRVHCGPGHGISVGSLGKYDDEQDVSGIMVADCDLTNTTNGLRIKTWAPSKPSSAYNITFVNISISSVDNPIIIDQHYCPHSTCQKEGESSVAIRDVKFINIQGESLIPNSVNIHCSQTIPCQGIEFSLLKLTSNGQPTTATCINSVNTFLEPDQIPSQCSA